MEKLITNLNKTMKNHSIDEMSENERQYILESLSETINDGLEYNRNRVARMILDGKSIDGLGQALIDLETQECACWKAHEALEKLLFKEQVFNVGDVITLTDSGSKSWLGLYLCGVVEKNPDDHGVLVVRVLNRIVPELFKNLFSGKYISMHKSYFRKI